MGRTSAWKSDKHGFNQAPPSTSVRFGANLLTSPHFENEDVATYLTEF